MKTSFVSIGVMPQEYVGWSWRPTVVWTKGDQRSQKRMLSWFKIDWRYLSPGRRVMQTKKRKEVVYEIGDRACLRVSPLRRVKQSRVKGKLAPRFVGPYRVLERMEKWPTSWSHPKDCQEFMMCFMFPSWRRPCRDGQYSPVRTLDPGKDNEVPRSRVWTS